MAPGDPNSLESVLEMIHKLDGAIKHTISDNVNTDVVPNDPNALGLSWLGDIATSVTELGLEVKTADELLQFEFHNGLLDDRKNDLIEKLVKIAASLPIDIPILARITNVFVQNLWNNMRHSPLTFLGDERRFRTADGSNNKCMYPQLGQSPSPYARTVTPKTELPPVLPAAGPIFDELMAREKFREHPNKISSMLFYLATLIIHDLFRTSDEDPNVAENTSYLDLGPLYGHNGEQQARVRLWKDGLLKPDAFHEIRVLGFPPGVASLLTCFNRFHNYVATNLAIINEGGRFTLKSQLTRKEARIHGAPEGKRDNDLFQTARLITCGLYVNTILFDYVGTITNLNATNSSWKIDPRANTTKIYGPSGIPEGIGNQVSVEFNLVYRWHSTISAKDEQWTNQFFEKTLKPHGVDPKNVTVTELVQALRYFLREEGQIDPGKRTFNGFERQTDGHFKDIDLITCLTEGTEDVAGAFGARNVPVVMRVVEMLGIEQARAWSVATLNEFRNFFGLVSHTRFDQISSNKQVARSLEALYRDPDLVELYPGLVAEDFQEPKVPGSGLCPGFTVGKSVLSDAVALVRGDRFYTTDYTAATLTNWGFSEVQANPQIARGGVMYKLLMKAFPRWYRGNSVYAMFPFWIPGKTHDVLEDLGKLGEYDFSRPSFTPKAKEIQTWNGVTAVLSNPETFGTPCKACIHNLLAAEII